MDLTEEGEASSSWGIWNAVGGGGEQESGESASPRPEADTRPPYLPRFDDTVNKLVKIDTKSAEFTQFLAHESRMLAEVIPVGTIKFDVELERVRVDRDDHKDLIVHVVCHREGLDPHWRCSFECEVTATFGDSTSKAQGVRVDARHKDNSLTMPVMRLPSESIKEACISVYIKMTAWKGFNPRLLHDFTKQHEYTNATLVVEDHPLYVTREILAIHSAFFNNLFFNENFNDAGKDEYILPDVLYTDMLLFLNLSYPETMVGRRETFVTSIDDLERVLLLSEQFSAPALKNLAEKMLRGTSATASPTFIDVHWTRLLYIADRFRLSEACSTQMRRLQSESDFIRLRRSEEFELLSARLRSRLLSGALEKLPPSTAPRKMRMPSRTGRIGQFSDVEVDDDESSDCEILKIITPPKAPQPLPAYRVYPVQMNPTSMVQQAPAPPTQPPAVNPPPPVPAAPTATAAVPAAGPARGVGRPKKTVKRTRKEMEKAIKEEVDSLDDSDDDQPGPSNRPPRKYPTKRMSTRSRTKTTKK